MARRESDSQTTSRRKVLKSVLTGSSIGLAGCAGNQQSGTTTDQPRTEEPGGTKTTVKKQSTRQTVNIAYLFPFTGDLSEFADPVFDAGLVAQEQINAAGGIHGKELNLLQQDTNCTPQQATSALRTVAGQDVVAVHGPQSCTIPALFKEIQTLEMPSVTSAGTTYLDDKGGKWVWRTVGSDTDLGRAWATHIVNQGWERVAIGSLDTSASISASNVLLDAIASTDKAEAVTDIRFSKKATSYRSGISKMLDADPDVIAVNMNTDKFILWAKNYRELGGEPPIMAGENPTGVPKVIEELGSQANGISGIQAGSLDTFKHYAEAHKEVLDKEPGPYSQTAYDAINVISVALQRADPARLEGDIQEARKAVIQNLRRIGSPPGKKVLDFPEAKKELEAGNEVDLEGATSTLNFDGNGNVVSPMQVMAVENQEWKTIAVYDDARKLIG